MYSSCTGYGPLLHTCTSANRNVPEPSSKPLPCPYKVMGTPDMTTTPCSNFQTRMSRPHPPPPHPHPQARLQHERQNKHVSTPERSRRQQRPSDCHWNRCFVGSTASAPGADHNSTSSSSSPSSASSSPEPCTQARALILAAAMSTSASDAALKAFTLYFCVASL